MYQELKILAGLNGTGRPTRRLAGRHKNLHSILLLVTALLLAAGLSGCDIKDAGFFAPVTDSELPDNGDDEQDEEDENGYDAPPSISMIPGEYTVDYTVLEYTCAIGDMEFSVPATLETDVALNLIRVLFPDAPSSIDGMYNGASGLFEGITETVEIGDGYTAREMWDVMFYPGMDVVAFGGISRVNLYDPQENPYCFVEYGIYGEKIEIP